MTERALTFHLPPFHLMSLELAPCNRLGQVVQKPISPNLGLNFNSGLSFCSKAFSQIIFSILFRPPNHQTVEKKELN